VTADASQTNHRFATKSNKMTSQKRAVLHMAFGYAGTRLLVWSPYFVFAVFFIDTVVILADSMTPLLGFFNFVVFMAPKVRTTRRMTMLGTRREAETTITKTSSI
jgi:hypothetical protein